jgi:hypothetical protein
MTTSASPLPYAGDEFKALRDEIKRCESEGLSVTLYVITAVILAIGLSDKQWMPKAAIPVLVQMLLLWGMHRYYGLLSLQKKLSTYIQVALEPCLPGLQWERHALEFERLAAKRTPAIIKALIWGLRRASHVYTLLSVVGLYLSASTLLSLRWERYDYLGYLGALALLHVMSAALLVVSVIRPPSTLKYLALWQAVLPAQENGEANPARR